MIFENLKELLNADFTCIINNYYLTFGAISLFNDVDSSKKLIGHSYENIDLSALGVNLKDINGLEISSQCFLKSGFRTAIRESHELIYEYCKKTHQLEKLKKTKWFHFARLIRNGTAHDFKFKFIKSDFSVLPVTWRSKTITKEMDNSPITLYFFNYKDCWDLLYEMEEFIKEIE